MLLSVSFGSRLGHVFAATLGNVIIVAEIAIALVAGVKQIVAAAVTETISLPELVCHLQQWQLHPAQ